MRFDRRILLAPVAAGCLLLQIASPGHAAQRGISIPPEAIVVQGTATITSVVNLPESATPNMFISFVLPPDYAPDTDITVRIYTQQAGGACSAVLNVNSATRRRNGFIEIGRASCRERVCLAV